MAEELGISKDMLRTIVREDLSKHKICLCCISWQAKRMETSGYFITMFDQEALGSDKGSIGKPGSEQGHVEEQT